MSDALLTEISGKLTDILGALKGSAPATPKTTTAAAPDKAAADKAAAAKKAAADKAAADKKAADEATAKAAAEKAAAAKAAAAKTAGPAAGTKGPNGKFSIEQVREKIREVATNANLGKQSAADILDQDGGGVKKVTDLKPENYDKVYEACQVALQSEGAAPAAAAPEDDLM